MTSTFIVTLACYNIK